MCDVVAGVGLGDGERDMHLAADHFRQIAQLLLLAAVEDERADAEDRQMNRAGRRHRAARGRDFAHHEGRLGDSKAAAAVTLGNRDAEIAGGGDRGEEVVGEFGAPIVLAPVFVRKVCAQGADLPDDLFLSFCQFEIHLCSNRFEIEIFARFWRDVDWLKT